MVAVLFWLSILLIAYTYIGYPVLLALLSTLKREPELMSGASTSVTILITAYNEEAVIAKKLENSLAIDYPKEQLHIFVAADGSSDRTVEIVERFASRGVELSFLPQRNGKMAAINRAISQVSSEIVLFSDANNMYEPDVVSKLIEPFADPTVGATTGAKLIIPDGNSLSGAEGIYWKYESWIKKNETRLTTCTSAVGEILAVRRNLYNAPPGNVINDDYYIALDLIRRGYKIFYVPEARSFEYASATMQDEMVRRARMNTGKYQAISLSWTSLPFHRPLVVWQIISHKFLRALLPFDFLGAFFASFLLATFQKDFSGSFFKLSVPYAQWIFGGQVLFYVFAALGIKFRFPGWIGKLIYLPAYLVSSNIAILRGFLGFLTKKQTNVWDRVKRSNV